jgi:hypothetical protein
VWPPPWPPPWCPFCQAVPVAPIVPAWLVPSLELELELSEAEAEGVLDTVGEAGVLSGTLAGASLCVGASVGETLCSLDACDEEADHEFGGPWHGLLR